MDMWYHTTVNQGGDMSEASYANATDEQLLILKTNALNEVIHGKRSVADVARQYGIPRTTLRDWVALERNKVPEGAEGSEGYFVKGRSTLLDADGNVVMQWVKTQIDQDQYEMRLTAALEALRDTLEPLPPIRTPDSTLTPLLNQYTITDFHMGMLAWGRETGDDWDIRIAEDVLTRCFQLMIDNAPPARVCVIAQLGDFLHSDFEGLLGLTPTSKHVLDTDGRASKIIRVALRALRHMIEQARAKHEEVHVLMAEGNHDMTSSIWLRETFAMLYENEPRVVVDTSPLPYYVYEHGETMLAFHHGHMKKIDELPSLFAAEFPQVWGRTKYRYGHCGHTHHFQANERHGMVVYRHPTLAARDAYAARGGWHSERGAECITYHEKHGRVGSNLVTPAMLDS